MLLPRGVAAVVPGVIVLPFFGDILNITWYINRRVIRFLQIMAEVRASLGGALSTQEWIRRSLALEEITPTLILGAFNIIRPSHTSVCAYLNASSAHGQEKDEETGFKFH